MVTLHHEQGVHVRDPGGGGAVEHREAAVDAFLRHVQDGVLLLRMFWDKKI